MLDEDEEQFEKDNVFREVYLYCASISTLNNENFPWSFSIFWLSMCDVNSFNHHSHICLQWLIFIQDVKIVTPVGSPDSWGYSSKMSISCPSFLKPDVEDLRISIGTFMKSGSGALGSLGGDGSQERVSFLKKHLIHLITFKTLYCNSVIHEDACARVLFQKSSL